MSNSQIYRKTLTFSLHRLLFNIICVVAVAALSIVGFAVVEKMYDKGLIGLAAGLVLGIIIVAVVAHFVSYTYSAGQIAMMTRGVTEGSLPEDVYHEGKRMVKERFLTVVGFYAATRAIKAIFNQIGRLITGAGKAIGGDTGEGIANAINIGIQVVIGFLSDCCLGWVFYFKEKSAFKATMEGCGVFFKNGKALLRNLGRIFGMGIASLLLIGGALSGVFYLILSNFTSLFQRLADEIVSVVAREGGSVPEWLTKPENLALVAAVILGIILWSIIHGAFIRPFILVGVLRNYMEAGLANLPTEADMASLANKSDKFAKYQKKGAF